MGYNDLLATGEYYHVFNKSIAGFRIFNSIREYERMNSLIRYYQLREIPVHFSEFTRLKHVEKRGVNQSIYDLSQECSKLVEIIAFCLMPTHIHLALKQLCDNGISKFMNNILNGYTRYFNVKHKRKGPLWVGRFKRVLVETDEYLLHLTRYIHLNPTTAELIPKLQEWSYSSYKEYVGKIKGNERITSFQETFDMNSCDYRKFVESRIDYQKELKKIKDLLLDETL